jgi:hypothetical protein
LPYLPRARSNLDHQLARFRFSEFNHRTRNVAAKVRGQTGALFKRSGLRIE